MSIMLCPLSLDILTDRQNAVRHSARLLALTAIQASVAWALQVTELNTDECE